MSKELMISEVAKNYNITKRTIRYYEEIGLLTNIKKNDSNYRYYNDDALKRLEQILLLRDLGFHINEINEILLSKDEDVIDNMLLNRYRKLHDDINNLISLRNIISSIIRIKNQNGIQKISIYQILKEQIYIHKKYERMFNVSQFVGDLVVVEFGVGLVESADNIIENIRNLRSEIKNKLNKEIPLVRIKDNTDLKENEYRIMIKDIIVRKEVLESVSSTEKATILTNGLKESLLYNIKNIIE